MLTPETAKAMTPEARTQLFESMAAEYYGTDRNGEMLVRDFGITRGTVSNWRKLHTVPLAVIYTLDAWLHSPRFAQTILGDWASIAPDLSKAALSLSQTAGKLASIGRRMPTSFSPTPDAAPHDTGASSDEASPCAASE